MGTFVELARALGQNGRAAWAVLARRRGPVPRFSGWNLRTRFQAFRQLDAAEQRLSAVLGALSDILVVQDRDGRYLETLGAFHGFGPHPGGARLGQTVRDRYSPDKAEERLALIKLSLDENRPVQATFMSALESGAESVLDLRIVPLSASTVLTVARDVTDQVHIRQQLQKRSDELLLFTKASRDLIGFVQNGRLLGLTQACAALTGYTLEHLATLPLRDMMEARYRDRARTQLLLVAEGVQQQAFFECVVFSRTGERIWLEVWLSASPDATDPLLRHVLMSARDLTAFKALEFKRLLGERALQNLPDGVVVLDAETGLVQWTNKGFLVMTGFSAEEVHARSLDSVLGQVAHKAPMPPAAEVTQLGSWTGEFVNTRRDGSQFPDLRRVSVFDDEFLGKTFFVVTIRDLSPERQQQQALRELAHVDSLTGLPNRAQFLHLLAEKVAELPLTDVGPHEPGSPSPSLSVYCLDLSKFSSINQSLGRAAGDLVLKKVGAGLVALLGPEVLVSRTEADEFSVMTCDQTAEQAEAIAQQMLNFFKHPMTVEGLEIFVNANVGISRLRSQSATADFALHQSHLAMEESVTRGEGLVGYYDEAGSVRGQRNLLLESGLRKALARPQNEFFLEYQPKVSLPSEELLGFEALCRWNSPTLGRVSPAEFIPVAESTGLIRMLGAWVFERACEQLAEWNAEGLKLLPVAVNLSVQQLYDPALPETLVAVARRHGIPLALLDLEVTESDMMRDVDKAVSCLSRLREHGFQVSLDDFGTGYSSMAYLQKLPLDTLKLDRSFVRPLGQDPESDTICKVILGLAKGLNLKTVAEGVETTEQRDFLILNLCDAMQGYLYSPPVSAQKVAALLGRLQGEMFS